MLMILFNTIVTWAKSSEYTWYNCIMIVIFVTSDLTYGMCIYVRVGLGIVRIRYNMNMILAQCVI